MKTRFMILMPALISMLAGVSLAGTKAVGGDVVTIGDQRIHTFTELGTSNLTVTSGGFVDVLVVAGGGGGGCLGGGGGAGGLVYTNSFFVEPGTYTVVVGGGGIGAPSRSIKGGNGTNSVFGTLTAIGGGGGGSYGTRDGLDGGSGGGSALTSIPGSGTPGQGHEGAASGHATVGGGGGGAGEPGHAGTSSVAGAGGDGLAYDISGTLTYYAGGGGGGANTAAPGGLGGGGDGTTSASDGKPGAPNTGGGGGGVRDTGNGRKGGNGGSGIVIVSYVLDDRGAAITGVATNVTETGAHLTGTLVSTGDPASDIVAFWGTSDGGSNIAAWATSTTLAAPQPIGDFSVPVTGLVPDQTYYYRAAASNEAGIGWASDSSFFITGGVQVEKVADANEAGLVPGSFRLYRPATTIDEAVTVLFELGGTATGGVDYVAVDAFAVIPAGETETTVAITPLSNWSVLADTTVTLTVLPGMYPVGAAASANLTIENYDIPAGANVWVAPAAGNASVASNWSLNRVPEAGDSILLSGFSSADLIWDAAATDVVASWTQEPDYMGTVVFETVYGDSGFTNFTIAGNAVVGGGTWKHAVNTTVETYRLRVTVGVDLTVDGGMIDVYGLGYDKSKGPGAAGTLDGGGHGGMGGDFYLDGTGGTTYGSLYAPVNLGSGGGTGKGGGAMLLTVLGTTTVAGSGAISANGADGGDGSGAGGSVWLITGAIAGDGAIRANGGGQLSFSTDNRAAGGGGRIAVVLTGAASDFSTWSGSIETHGGLSSTSYRHGAAGTVYLKLADGSDMLIVDNDGTTNPDMVRTQLPEAPAVDLSAIDEVRIAGGSALATAASTVLDLATVNLVFAEPTATLAITDLSAVTFPANWVLEGGTIAFENVSPPLVDVTIGADGTLTHRENMETDVFGLNLALAGNLTLQNGGRIAADTKGYASKSGPGYYNGDYSGGAHGGGASGLYDRINNATYGSILVPADIGSGGVGGRGGGRILLAVAGTTSIDAASTITANGQIGADGGGSGGTIHLTTGTLTGSGAIRANGASSGLTRGGGGGGRMAVVLTGSGADFSAWSGVFSTYGGPNDNNANQGAAGTVYLQDASQSAGSGAVLVDNDNLTFDATPPSTILPAHAAATEKLTRTAWTVQRKSRILLVQDATLHVMDLAADSILDLDGFTLTVNEFVLDGDKLSSGEYAALDLASASIVDATGTGSLVVRGLGSLIIVR